MPVRTFFTGFCLMMFCWLATPIALAETKLPEAQENRARALFVEFRCVVCQNQSIGDSDADVAKDLRAIVREQIAAGKSDLQIRDFLVARYGEFILLKPVFSWHTALLWLAPVVLLILGGLLVFSRGRSARRTETPKLTAEEEARAAAYLQRKD